MRKLTKKDKEFLKKIGYLEHDVCFVNKLACIKSNSADSKFIFFVIKATSNNPLQSHLI